MAKGYRIKILFTIPNFDTAGSGRALLNIAQNLDAEKFEPHIACSHDQGTFFKVVEASKIPIHILDFTAKMKPYLIGIMESYRISKKLRAIRPDIIHSFNYSADYSEPLAARISGIKYIFTKKNMNWGGASQNSWKLRTLLSHAIIAQNSDMISNFFPDNSKAILIERGVDITKFKRKTTDNLKEDLGFKEYDRILCCVANISRIKGTELLLRSFKIAAMNRPRWILILLGDKRGDYAKSMEVLTKDLKIDKKVRFLGKRSNVEDYLSISEATVLPTIVKGEGSPVSLLEAMAAENLVLGSDVPGIRDMLQNHKDHLIEPEDVNKWAIALSRIFENTTDNNLKAGQLFRKHVEKNYSINKEVASTEKLYQELYEIR